MKVKFKANVRKEIEAKVNDHFVRISSDEVYRVIVTSDGLRLLCVERGILWSHSSLFDNSESGFKPWAGEYTINVD